MDAALEALEMFGGVFGGATAYPKAKGVWRDDEREGALIKDEPVVVHCYTTPADIEDKDNLADLGRFCRQRGREAKQGEIGLLVGDEYFAIREFAEEIEARFRVPAGGGRPTDPRWTERRQLPLAPRTRKRLEALAATVRERGGIAVEPMQLAALLLEKTTDLLTEDQAEELVRPRRASG